MKKLLITNVFPPHIGGSGRWLWELYRRMPRSEVVVAAGEHPQQQAFDATHDVDLVRLPLAMPGLGMINWRSARRYFQLYRKIARLIKKKNIEQIHCGTILPEGWLAWLLHRRFGIPYVCYVHGEETSVVRQSRELTWMTRRVLASAQCVIVNSKNTFRVLRDQWQVPEQRLQLMYPGVDVNRFVPAERDPAVRQRLGWNNRTVVLTVGRLQTRKGHDHLILALNYVKQFVADVLYVIAGNGERRDYLENLVREHQLQDHVQFRGDIGDSELISCYQQCDLFALPNRDVDGDFEGFGMVLLEAQACGKAVLAGTSGGTAETMRVGETGRLVNCDQPQPLAEMLVEMLGDREQLQVMGQAGRRWTSEHFGWDALAKQAADLFQSLTVEQPTAAKRPLEKLERIEETAANISPVDAAVVGPS